MLILKLFLKRLAKLLVYAVQFAGEKWVDLENNVVFKTLNKTCDMFTINLFKRLTFYVTYNQLHTISLKIRPE